MHNSEKNSELDEIDRKILCILQRDARISFRDLGTRIHLSSNATADRVRRLKESGVIRGYRAEIDPARLGFSLQAQVDIHLQPGASAQSFEAIAKKVAGVVSITILTGALDLRVRVACKDQAALVQLIAVLRSRAGAQETNTAVILRELETGFVME